MAKKIASDNTVFHNRNIENIFADAFGRYAKYIIQDRALPDIRDGLKPVQRRIIYAMNDLQILHNTAYKKSARSVGEVIGKYHPHGDTSIYDAMVRMSQDWKNNIPLIDMHGNNGSIDNDPAAAMRYTESRLSLYSEMLIKDIKKSTVKFIENFDGSENEPTVLPTLLPNLLINGASGIAAGYATSVPPFNINEVLDCLIKRIDAPNCTMDTIIKTMPGPDFPTGGIILNKEEIRKAYETGRGRINIRSKIELRSKKQAYITEIPFEVNKADLIDEINDCAEKYDVLNIMECHDETDQNGISICITLKNSDNFDFVKNFLFKNTSLQISFNFNMIAINERKPCMVDMFTYLDTFIQHCNTIVLNATNFDLDKAKKRSEIVTGLIKAIKIVDAIVDLIRKSENKSSAMQGLMNKFQFTEVQADAIVNLKLYRLSNNDVSELETELTEINSLISEYEKIVNDKDYRAEHIKNIYREYKKIFKTPRRSEISDEEAIINIDQTETVEDKEVYLVVTRDGYIKNVPPRSFNLSEYEEMGLKEGDVQIAHFKTSQKNKLVLVTSKGNYVVTPIHKVEPTMWKDLGMHVNSIAVLEPDDKIIDAFEYVSEEDTRVITIASKKGMIKRTKVSDLSISRTNKTFTIMKLSEGDEVVKTLIGNENETDVIGAISVTGNTLLYPMNQISIVGRNAAGVANINTPEDIASIFLADPNKKYLLIGTTGGVKKILTTLLPMGKRNGKTKPLLIGSRSTVLNAFYVNDDEIFTVLFDDKWEFVNSNEIKNGDGASRLSQPRAHKIVWVDDLKTLEKGAREEAE